MNEFWIFIFVSVFAINSLDKAKSVQLEETSLKIIDEIFGEGWWDNDKAEEWHKLTLEQNFLHQIDRQNTQIGQIDPNSTDQNPLLTEFDHSGQIEPNSTDKNPPLTESDHSGQIKPNSTDQNPLLTASDHSGQIEPNSPDQNPLTESDHSDNAKNGKEQIEIMKQTSNAEDERKRNIIDKFHTMRNEFRQKGKFPYKERTQIEHKIANHLGVNRNKIFEWKKELGLSRKAFYEKEERKHLLEKFDQKKAELTRDGFKNTQNNLDKTVAKELGVGFATIYRWKNKLGQISASNNKYSHSEQKELIKRYYKIKDKNPKISDEKIAKRLKISRETLCKWKKQFKRQQLHPNSVDGHFVEENAAANVQEI